MHTLRAFSNLERRRAKLLLAAKVASMMGRKLEEGDWSEVYCEAKNIPDKGWSNLHIDINHDGVGVEFKMLRIHVKPGHSIRDVCGTSRMHPSLTRSVRIDNAALSSHDVMSDVFRQYSRHVDQHIERVREHSPDGSVDLRFGWLLWEDGLQEFLYFEEKMCKPDPDRYYAIWNETPARGVRKASRSLWIYDKATNRKRFSVTTSASVKIQPYFDVPQPNDPNLVYFRVQSEPIEDDTVLLWVTPTTASRLEEQLGSVKKEIVSQAILAVPDRFNPRQSLPVEALKAAVPIPVSREAFDRLVAKWVAVNDEHRMRLFLKSID